MSNERFPWEDESAPRPRQSNVTAYRAGAVLAILSTILMLALLAAAVVWVWTLVL